MYLMSVGPIQFTREIRTVMTSSLEKHKYTVKKNQNKKTVGLALSNQPISELENPVKPYETLAGVRKNLTNAIVA